jgi:alpha-tubulin suppressor-like RCC1 family protein
MRSILPPRRIRRQRKTGRTLGVAIAAATALALLACGAADPGVGDLATDGAGPPSDFANIARDFSLYDGPPPDAWIDLDAGSGAIGVAQGPCFGCAWRGGQAFCWGSNDFGELGDGTRTRHNGAMPVLGLGSIGTIAQMTVGCGNQAVSGHTCALNTNGELWCWGCNQRGQLGDQSATDQLLPKKITGLPPLVQVSAGARHTCALTNQNHVLCWGANDSLQIGDGSTFDRPAPTPLNTLTDVVQISAGHYHNCARRSSGVLACWGANNYGETGNGNVAGVPTPTDMTVFTDATMVQSGGFHTCALRASGGAWCWGAGMFGTIGNGGMTPSQLIPAQVILPYAPVELTTSTAICARDTAGLVYCWAGTVDALDNTVINYTPVDYGVSDAVSLGGSCAVRATGAIQCWGFNDLGQIGDGTMSDRAAPVDVQGIVWQ